MKRNNKANKTNKKPQNQTRRRHTDKTLNPQTTKRTHTSQNTMITKNTQLQLGLCVVITSNFSTSPVFLHNMQIKRGVFVVCLLVCFFVFCPHQRPRKYESTSPSSRHVDKHVARTNRAHGMHALTLATGGVASVSEKSQT